MDEVFVKINGKTHYLLRVIDREVVVLETFPTKRRDRNAALIILRKSVKRFGSPEIIVTDKLRSYAAVMKVAGNADRQETGRWLNKRIEYSLLEFLRRDRAMLRFLQMRSFRNSQPFTRQSKTISIRNAIFTAGPISS